MLIDARGLQCPLPVLKTKSYIESLPPNTNGLLTVLVDNEIACQNLNKLTKKLNLAFNYEKKSNFDYVVSIIIGENVKNNLVESGKPVESKESTQLIKANESKELQEEENLAQSQPLDTESKIGGHIIVIDSDSMGTGDPILGKLLLKGFIFSLTQTLPIPQKIILYNRGVFLSTEIEDTINDLKLLENLGTEIVSCGTCLNHYQLQLKVGTPTNMYEIVEWQTAAKKIIKI
ncbi:hypothetical protein AN643_00155 [Candidatus Epulonipiscioides saccharophilum]|nr:hypothetical protein AN643_00155 [Epulopiscium sp. SCG-B10WGA-EpuloB]